MRVVVVVLVTGGKQSQLLVLSLSLKFYNILYVGFNKAKESDKGRKFDSEKFQGLKKILV